MANWAVNYRKKDKSGGYSSAFFKGDGDRSIEGLKKHTDYEVIVTSNVNNKVLIWENAAVINSGESGKIRMSFSGMGYSIKFST